ncbi:hypothetical protein N7520_005755 [Penicillium odoratum]|uniref:uncharacterized protein n=1 Tax=Penicillium odoratum TaxID=1167516 RepID=UPI0025481297|nr:uncharacterized protein N7520_005755 [Penicillium odoratum]KAJ5758599.1 hypothetical protein N7520_005755 [Penicillium odoratum]
MTTMKNEKELEQVLNIEKISSEAFKGTVQDSPSFMGQFKEMKRHKCAILAAFACSTTPILIEYDLTLIGSIIANSHLTIIGTLIELFSTNWKVWIVAKIFMGAAMGSMQANTHTYVSEITPTSIRGFMLSLFQLWIILGQLLASCILEGTSHVRSGWSWKGAVLSQFGPALFCLVMFIPLVPESPYYLIAKDRLEDARSAIARLQGNEDFNCDEQVLQIQETIAHERQAKNGSASFLESFQGTNLRRTLLACLPLVMQIFMGYPLCGNYLSYFLTQSGMSNAFLVTVISVVYSRIVSLSTFVTIERL